MISGGMHNILHMKQTPYDVLRNLKGKYLRYYLAGFVDGEGSFNVSFAKHPTAKFGWLITARFQVYQHNKHKEILEMYQEIFQTGRIHPKHGSNVSVFTIQSTRILYERVVPFFERYPVATKHDVFQKWKTIVEMLIKKEHLTNEGFGSLVNIAHDMNTIGKGRKWSKEILLAMIQPQESSETIRLTSALGRKKT